MGKYVNGRSKSYLNYSKGNYDNFHYLDFIARTIHDIAWSRQKNNQKLINLDCVAVCVVNDRDLWVASNNISIEDCDIEQLDKIMCEDGLFLYENIYIVHNGNGHMHAEMQLVQELINEGIETKYIGVSKPCCKFCANELNEQKIKYSLWHDSRVKQWEAPKYKKPLQNQ